MMRRALSIALLCFAAGCAFEPAPLGSTDAPGELVPSSGARREHLDNVTKDLVVPTTRVMGLDTDTGEITLYEEPITPAVAAELGRPARPGVLPADERIRPPGQQVIDGIGFYILSEKVSVLAVSSLTIERDAALFPYGSHAIVLLSTGDVSIRGILDVSAPCDDTTRTCAGPGGGDGARVQEEAAGGCAPGKNGVGSLSTVGRTGGGGGGLGTDGAAGGTAGSGALPGGLGGSLASGECPGPSADSLAGGSGGGAGAPLDFGGSGGGGGGAVQITSLARIVIDPPASDFISGVFANGAGGGGATDGGGGGGGAGGMILLEAPAISIESVFLTANGGAGGAGGLAGAPSNDGEDGQPNGDAAAGGTGQFAGGAGGAASAPPEIGVGGGDSTGGGGGSVGIIVLRASQLDTDGAEFSPTPIVTEPRSVTAAESTGPR
jgi:hypothetical protein